VGVVGERLDDERETSGGRDRCHHLKNRRSAPRT
jgi:hypothetical protein